MRGRFTSEFHEAHNTIGPLAGWMLKRQLDGSEEASV